MENVQIIAYRFNYPDDMEHSGVKGQQWGVRRYQNPDGSLTPLGRIRYRTNGEFKKSVDRQRNLAKAREARAAKKQQEAEEAKAKEEKEVERQRIIKTGTAEEALKIRGELSSQEMSYISTRLQWEQNMQKTIAEGETEVGKFFKKMDKGVKYAESGAKLWNTAANVVNAFNGEKIMPKIDTNITSGNKDAIKQRKKDKKAELDGKKPMPTADDILKDISKYSNEELKRVTDRKNAEDNFKKAFTEQPKYKAPSAEDILKDPDKYSDDDVSKAATRKKNLKNLDDNPGNKNSNANTADLDDIIAARVNEILEERLRDS